jgi:hypothetical protein
VATGVSSTTNVEITAGSGYTINMNSPINVGNTITSTGSIILGTTYGITSTGILQLGSGNGITTNGSSFNTGSGTITTYGITSTTYLSVQNISALDTSSSVILYSGQGASGSVSLGTTGSVQTLLNGNVRIVNSFQSQHIQPINAGSGVNLYSEQTAGNINIGTSDARTSGNIQLGSNVVGGMGDIYCRGILRAQADIYTQTISPNTSSSTVSIFTNQTGGNLNIGTNDARTTGNIQLGSNAVGGAGEVLCRGILRAQADIYTQNIFTKTSNSAVDIFSNQTAGNINIGMNDARTSGNIQLGSNAVSGMGGVVCNGVITAQSGIIMGSNQLITLSSGTKTSSSQLGFWSKTSLGSFGPLTAGTDTNIYNTSISAGTWMIRFMGTLSAGALAVSVSGATTFDASDATIASSTPYFNIITTRSYSSATTQYLIVRGTTSSSLTNVFMYLTRVG